MHEARDYHRSLERSRAARTRHHHPSTFTMYGRVWDLLPDVFAPLYTPATRIALKHLGLTGGEARSHPRSLLEIGTGTGIVAVSGALAGCPRVLATDINPAAVRNTALNAARHGVTHRVRPLRSDLFGALDPQDRFDTVFWHSNFVLAPEDYAYRNLHERAYVDAGYATHRRFLTEAPHRLTPGGSALLHFSTRGDLSALRRIARSCGHDVRVLRSTTAQEGPFPIDHMLVQVTGAPDGDTSGHDPESPSCALC